MVDDVRGRLDMVASFIAASKSARSMLSIEGLLDKTLFVVEPVRSVFCVMGRVEELSFRHALYIFMPWVFW